MWKSRSVAEPKITLNKHKTSSPFGASALYSGVKQDGRPQSIGPVLLTESQINSPSGRSPSAQACLCQGSRPWGLLSCGRAQSASEQACGQWARSPRDQPLEREEGPVSWRGGRAGLIYRLLFFYWPGGWEFLRKSENTLFPRTKAGTLSYFHIQ